MARVNTIDEVISTAVAKVIHAVIPALQRHIATLAADELERNLAVHEARPARRVAARRRRPAAELTRWVADRNARRVPNFVIEMTGLDLKKAIVARYGPGAVFEKGRSLPQQTSEAARAGAVRAGAREAARQVRAKAPSIRKAAAIQAQ